MKTVSIFGSCISRDIFPANDPNYEVQQYVGFSSPMSIFMPLSKAIDPEEVDTKFEGKNFTKRCFVLDHNKTTFSFIKKRVSNYFIIDVLDARLRIFRYGNNFTTYSNFVLLNQKLLEDKCGQTFDETSSCDFSNDENIDFLCEEALNIYSQNTQLISPFSFSDDEWYKCIDLLCEQILEIYSIDQIIIHENFLVEEFLDKNRILNKFKPSYMDIPAINNLLKKLIARMEENLKGCHIIRMPENVVADALNKWKLHPAHFHKLYYEYGNKAMQIITNGCDNEEQMLEDLRELYSYKFDILKKNVLIKSLESKNKVLTFSNKKLSQYSNSFKEIICNYSAITEYIRKICQERNLTHVAIYGDFCNSEVLAHLLKKCGVTLDYIICQWDNGTAPVVYPTTAKEYPAVDAIINCDIMTLEKTSSILSQKVPYPVYSVFDFLPYYNP